MEKRACKRYPLQIPILFKKGGKSYWSITEDISLGGLFFQSFHPPAPGEELEIHLGRARGTEDLVFQGKVIHRRERNKSSIPGDPVPKSAGVGISFAQAPLGFRKELISFFTEMGPLANGDTPLEGKESGANWNLDAQGPDDDYNKLENPEAIEKVFECLCKKIFEIHLKRVGSPICYSIYFRDLLQTSSGLLVQAEPVELKDADRILSGRIPLALYFSLGNRTYTFSVSEHPRALMKDWTFPLPTVLYFKKDRRHFRFSFEMKNPLTLEFPDPFDPGWQRVKNVIDMNFTGLSFKNYPGEEVYAVGTQIQDVMVYAFDHFCWKTDARVKHTSLVCQPGGVIYQKVGLEFPNSEEASLAEIPRIKQGEMEEITGKKVVSQHLKQVSKGGAKFLAEMKTGILFTDGLLRMVEGNGQVHMESSLLCQGPGGSFDEGRISYHYLFRGIYHFFSAQSFVENGFLRIEAPDSIYKAKRRRALRVKPKEEQNRFCFLHPMLGKRLSFPIRDISVRGLSFKGDWAQHLLWKGFSLRSCEILLGDEFLPLGSVEVKSTSRAVNQEGKVEKCCGVEFLDLPPHTEKIISAYIFRQTNPKIHSLTAEKIENLWQLFYDSGFIYPSKDAYIKKIKPQINDTWRRLLSTETSFYKNIVFREGGEELGTASAVQVYENTWMLQHLAATAHPAKLVSKYVLLGLAHFLMENQEIKYLITYFRKENSFPRMIYRGFLGSYPHEEQLRFTRHHFLSRELDDEDAQELQLRDPRILLPRGVIIEDATEIDREIIENYFRKTTHPLLVRSRSLYKDLLFLPETSAVFFTKGLSRERTCLVAKDREIGMIAFALLENSSQGINLSGLLNSFSLWSVRGEGERHRRVRRGLIEMAAQRYRAWGARSTICLTTEDDITDYQASGFNKIKEYICFTSTRRAIKSYYDYVQELFGPFEERNQRSNRKQAPRQVSA